MHEADLEQSGIIYESTALPLSLPRLGSTKPSGGFMINFPCDPGDGSVTWRKEQTDALLNVVSMLPKDDDAAVDATCRMLVWSVYTCGLHAKKWFSLLLFFTSVHAPDPWARGVIVKMFEIARGPEFSTSEEMAERRAVAEMQLEIESLQKKQREMAEEHRARMEMLAIEMDKAKQGVFGKMLSFFTGS
jgi:hypothetical protein